jgi:hypothetical protein
MIKDDMCLIEKKKVSSQDMCLYYVQNYFLLQMHFKQMQKFYLSKS